MWSLTGRPEVVSEHRGAAERDDRAAVFDEFLQLRNRLLDRHATEPLAIFGRDVGGRRLSAEAAAATAALTLRNAAVGEEQHVVLRLEVAGVERGRIDDFVRELELLEQPAHVA